MERLDKAPGRHGQPKVFVIEPRDFAERQPALRVQLRGRHDRLRPQLRRGRAERIRRLQRVPPLYAAATLLAGADVDLEGPNDRAHPREFSLILRRHAGLDYRPCTRRTRPGQRRVVLFIDSHGRAAPGDCERTARLARAPRGIQLAPQAVVLAAQPLVFPLQAFVLAPQPVALALCSLSALTQPLNLGW
jgi:hypothetical protein